VRTPEEIRDVPPEQRTPAELYQYGTHGPFVEPFPRYPQSTAHAELEEDVPDGEVW
jgi:hypothetical protein